MARFGLRLLASLAALATTYAALAEDSQTIGSPRDSSAVLVPSKDPFYAVPDDIEDYEPGAILRHRHPPSAIVAFQWPVANIHTTHQVLYRTNDNVGNATATVLTVMIPKNANYSKIVSFQIAEDSATIDCAPSYGFQQAVESNPLLNSATCQVQLLLIEGALARGLPVVTADIAGPHGALGSSRLAGYAILDGIRAAVHSGNFTGIKKDSNIGMWGYSGGSGVTQAAAELQPSYAPELDIAGAAIGGVGSTNATATLAINKTPDANLLPSYILGLGNQYPEYRKLIDQHLKPQFKDEFYKPLNQCLEANMKIFNNRDILGMFDDYKLLFENLVFLQITKDNKVDGVPKIPFYWYQSVQDQLASIDDIDAQVKKYCADGVSVQYIKNDSPNVTHTNYGLIGTPGVLDWLEGLLDGKVPKAGCSTTTLHKSKLDSAFRDLFPKYIQASLLKFQDGE